MMKMKMIILINKKKKIRKKVFSKKKKVMINRKNPKIKNLKKVLEEGFNIVVKTLKLEKHKMLRMRCKENKMRKVVGEITLEVEKKVVQVEEEDKIKFKIVKKMMII